MSIFRIPRVVVATLLVALMAPAVRPAQAAAPPPVAGELLPSADGPAAVEEIPQLICPADAAARRAAHPGVLLACQEQQFSAKSAPDLLALAQRLEAAGLFDEAGHRWRTLGGRGGGARGLEAGRRANAIAALGLAQDAAVRGKARRGKARLLSAMQTLERQAKTMAWPVPAALRQAAVRLARAAHASRQAKRWQAMIAADQRPSWFTGRLRRGGRRAPKVVVERCLGGVGYDLVRDARRLPNGEVLAVGEATAADGDTQLRTWLLDPTGRTRRRADFGAGGPDRPFAMALDGAAGAWVVGQTDAEPGSDAFFVRVDLHGRVLAHAARDGGGVDRAVAVLRLAAGRAVAVAEADITGAGDLWLLQLDAAGKITADSRIRREGKQRVHTVLLAKGRQGPLVWIGGSSDGAGFLEAFDLSGASKTTVRGRAPGSVLPGPVLAVTGARRGGLWVVGRRTDGSGWFGVVDRKGRLRLKRRFKQRLPKGARVQLLRRRRGALLWVRGPGRFGAAWVATLGRRGRLKGKTSLSDGGATSVNVLLPAGKKALIALGAAKGCGRGLLDGWFAHLTTR